MNRVHDLGALLAEVPRLAVDATTSAAQAEAAMREVDALNGATLGLVRFSGLTPWERHPDGDEMLHVLEGAVEVIVLGDGETIRAVLRPGSLFVVPRGLWHRQHAQPTVALLFATPAARSEVSWAEDPRAE